MAVSQVEKGGSRRQFLRLRKAAPAAVSQVEKGGSRWQFLRLRRAARWRHMSSNQMAVMRLNGRPEERRSSSGGPAAVAAGVRELQVRARAGQRWRRRLGQSRHSELVLAVHWRWPVHRQLPSDDASITGGQHSDSAIRRPPAGHSSDWCSSLTPSVHCIRLFTLVQYIGAVSGSVEYHGICFSRIELMWSRQ